MFEIKLGPWEVENIKIEKDPTQNRNATKTKEPGGVCLVMCMVSVNFSIITYSVLVLVEM